MTCTCGRLSIGDGRNWNPDCDEHGLASSWWTSPGQNERLRDLQTQARIARATVTKQ